MNPNRTPRTWRRNGIGLPLVLLCIVLAMALGATLVQRVLLYHHRAQLNGQQCQSLWMAESGVQRAISKLRKSPEYRGEVWRIPAVTLGGTDAGRVTIRVEPADGEQRGWTVYVEAIYPDHPRHRVIEQRDLFVAEVDVAEAAKGSVR